MSLDHSDDGDFVPGNCEIDLVNLYVKEIREPKFHEVKRGQDVNKRYNITYLPNGKQAEIKSF